MRLRRFVSPVVTLAVLGGAGYAAYRTQDRWVPHVFPTKSETKAGDGHDHAEGGGHEGHDHGPRSDRVKLSPQAQKNLGLPLWVEPAGGDARVASPPERHQTFRSVPLYISLLTLRN